jgi:hypothetical protein
VNWICLASGRNQWRDLANTLSNFVLNKILDTRGLFPGVKATCAEADHHLHLFPRSKIHGAVP